MSDKESFERGHLQRQPDGSWKEIIGGSNCYEEHVTVHNPPTSVERRLEPTAFVNISGGVHDHIIVGNDSFLHQGKEAATFSSILGLDNSQPADGLPNLSQGVADTFQYRNVEKEKTAAPVLLNSVNAVSHFLDITTDSGASSASKKKKKGKKKKKSPLLLKPFQDLSDYNPSFLVAHREGDEEKQETPKEDAMDVEDVSSFLNIQEEDDMEDIDDYSTGAMSDQDMREGDVRHGYQTVGESDKLLEERMAKAKESERLSNIEEAGKKAKEEAHRLEADRKAKRKPVREEEEQLVREKDEADRKAKEETVRLACREESRKNAKEAEREEREASNRLVKENTEQVQKKKKKKKSSLLLKPFQDLTSYTPLLSTIGKHSDSSSTTPSETSKLLLSALLPVTLSNTMKPTTATANVPSTTATLLNTPTGSINTSKHSPAPHWGQYTVPHPPVSKSHSRRSPRDPVAKSSWTFTLPIAKEPADSSSSLLGLIPSLVDTSNQTGSDPMEVTSPEKEKDIPMREVEVPVLPTDEDQRAAKRKAKRLAESERLANIEEADKKAKEEADRLEAERIAREEVETNRLAREEARRKAKESEREAREECNRLAKEEATRIAEAERVAKIESERLAKAEAERKAKKAEEEKEKLSQEKYANAGSSLVENPSVTMEQIQKKKKKKKSSLLLKPFQDLTSYTPLLSSIGKHSDSSSTTPSETSKLLLSALLPVTLSNTMKPTTATSTIPSTTTTVLNTPTGSSNTSNQAPVPHWGQYTVPHPPVSKSHSRRSPRDPIAKSSWTFTLPIAKEQVDSSSSLLGLIPSLVDTSDQNEPSMAPPSAVPGDHEHIQVSPSVEPSTGSDDPMEITSPEEKEKDIPMGVEIPVLSSDEHQQEPDVSSEDEDQPMSSEDSMGDAVEVMEGGDSNPGTPTPPSPSGLGEIVSIDDSEEDPSSENLAVSGPTQGNTTDDSREEYSSDELTYPTKDKVVTLLGTTTHLSPLEYPSEDSEISDSSEEEEQVIAPISRKRKGIPHRLHQHPSNFKRQRRDYSSSESEEEEEEGEARSLSEEEGEQSGDLSSRASYSSGSGSEESEESELDSPVRPPAQDSCVIVLDSSSEEEVGEEVASAPQEESLIHSEEPGESEGEEEELFSTEEPSTEATTSMLGSVEDRFQEKLLSGMEKRMKEIKREIQSCSHFVMEECKKYSVEDVPPLQEAIDHLQLQLGEDGEHSINQMREIFKNYLRMLLYLMVKLLRVRLQNPGHERKQLLILEINQYQDEIHLLREILTRKISASTLEDQWKQQAYHTLKENSSLIDLYQSQHERPLLKVIQRSSMLNLCSPKEQPTHH